MLAIGLLTAAGCSGDDDSGNDDDQAYVDRTHRDIERIGAQGLADALQVMLQSDHGLDDHPRDVDRIQNNVDDLLADSYVTGIEDADDDGQDDDGTLETHVTDEFACVSISPDGRVDVHGGRC